MRVSNSKPRLLSVLFAAFILLLSLTVNLAPASARVDMPFSSQVAVANENVSLKDKWANGANTFVENDGSADVGWDHNVINPDEGNSDNQSFFGTDERSMIRDIHLFMQGLFMMIYGIVVVVFAVKVIGRAILNITTDQRGETVAIPTFFLTSSERSTDPIMPLTTMGGVRGRGGRSGRGGMMGGAGNKNATRKMQQREIVLSQHPFRDFFREFLVFSAIALVVFILMEGLYALLTFLLSFIPKGSDKAPFSG